MAPGAGAPQFLQTVGDSGEELLLGGISGF